MPKSIYRPEYECFLAELRRARLGAGLTQDELAARLGRPQSYLSKVESGERRMDVIELRDFCIAVGLDPLDFLAGLERAIRSLLG
jgi:transcriptional regulator with XRE-family HTH domain